MVAKPRFEEVKFEDIIMDLIEKMIERFSDVMSDYYFIKLIINPSIFLKYKAIDKFLSRVNCIEMKSSNRD